MGQSYVLRQTSLRQDPSLDAPAIKDLQPSDIVAIADYMIDTLGNRWFRISSQGINGYVRTQDLAPPKGTNPDRSFEILRHSLLGLDDPAALPEASAAVDYFRKRFPDSLHGDEVVWLLAESTRKLGEHSDRREALLESASKQYATIAQGSGEFAEPARQALAQLAGEPQHRRRSHTSQSGALGLSIIGGSLTSSYLTPPGSPRRPVRRVTVLSQTPLFVRLTEPVQMSPGVAFRGQIDQDIQVNNQLAIPKGSLCHMTLVGGGMTPDDTGTPSSVRLRLNAVVIDNQSYGVSAATVRIEPPATASHSRPTSRLSSQLLAGTRVMFRLNAPLVVTHP